VRLFNQLLNELAQQGRIAVEKELVRLAGHRVTLAGDQEEHVNRLAALYRRGGLSPPTLKEAAAALEVSPDKLKQLLTLLVNQGHLVKVKEDLYFHREAIAQIKGQLVDFLKANREITVLQFKDLTQTSRKFTIPLLEYFDSARTTVRVGETRRLREGA
jgi:selenocysteine-specific elongation factor